MHHSPEQFIFWTALLSSPLLPLVLAWEIIWKSIALWKAARQNQLYWFISIAIVNSVGILPIIYIVFFQKDRNKKKK